MENITSQISFLGSGRESFLGAQLGTLKSRGLCGGVVLAGWMESALATLCLSWTLDLRLRKIKG